MNWFKKGRIVQFGDGTYGYQKLLIGFIPLNVFLINSDPCKYDWHENITWCKYKTLESLKELLNKIENYKNPDRIVRVVRETKLEKALE